jgi:hypothetical protein
VCPFTLKDSLGGLHHSLVTNCLKGRYTFFVFNEVTSFYTSGFKIFHRVNHYLLYFAIRFYPK